jgi:hypothetical protein
MASTSNSMSPSVESLARMPQKYVETIGSLHSGRSSTAHHTSSSTLIHLSTPKSHDRIKHPEDDSEVQLQPSRHVDYLSHYWKEEDIWLSWKHIMTNRNAYENRVRLENALWRAWIKSKEKLKTIAPETLNWSVTCRNNQRCGSYSLCAGLRIMTLLGYMDHFRRHQTIQYDIHCLPRLAEV